ncbi:hypothetical protein [Azospirillum sp.]|nr:hypothetical protein [Azospirillum sp.]HYF88032.1 hypothetical protein [Azospirillum sp.]
MAWNGHGIIATTQVTPLRKEAKALDIDDLFATQEGRMDRRR